MPRLNIPFPLALLSEIYLSHPDRRYLPDPAEVATNREVALPLPALRRMVHRLIIETNHARCPFSVHHLLYLRGDVSPRRYGTPLEETAMSAFDVPHWQASNLTQLEQLLIIPDHPTSNEALPLAEYLSRYPYLATRQLYANWDIPDWHFEQLPQQFIDMNVEFPAQGELGAPLLSALRHPSIIRRLEAYADYVKVCYTLMYEKLDWIALAQAVIGNDAQYIMQFTSLFNIFDEWLTGDTVLAIQKWRTHELHLTRGYGSDIEREANPATAKPEILRYDALTMTDLWHAYPDCCIKDGNASRPGEEPEFRDLDQLIGELKEAEETDEDEAIWAIARRVRTVDPIFEEFVPPQDRTAEVYRRVLPGNRGTVYRETMAAGYVPFLVRGGEAIRGLSGHGMHLAGLESYERMTRRIRRSLPAIDNVSASRIPLSST